MKTISSMAASAALAIGLAFGAAASNAQTAPQMGTCDGKPFAGDYIVVPHPSFAPMTKEMFNIAAQETLVGKLETLGVSGSYLVATPTDSSMDCKDFMKKMRDTGLVKDIEPDWLIKIDPVQP